MHYLTHIDPHKQSNLWNQYVWSITMQACESFLVYKENTNIWYLENVLTYDIYNIFAKP